MMLATQASKKGEKKPDRMERMLNTCG